MLGLAAAGCVPPRVQPLSGSPTTRPLPRAALPSGHTRIIFRWRYSDPELDLAGDGRARLAAPDSARLDFVFDKGTGGGFALLIGDTLVAPTASSRALHRYLPSPPLLWAALGRFAVPPGRDTTRRQDGDTLRADVLPGKGLRAAWRAAFVGATLVSLERVGGGRVREIVTRGADSSGAEIIQYQRLGSSRTLTLTQVQSESVASFNASIWRRRR